MERSANLPAPVANAIPFGLAFIGILIANFPVSLLNGMVPPPLFVLMPIYFWSLVRPDLMGPYPVFALGVLQDLFSGGHPMGLWALSFVVTYFVIDRNRDTFAGLGGIYAILGFATTVFVTCGTAFVIVTAYNMRFSSIALLATELATTVIFYIPIVLALGFIHRRFVGPLRREF